MNDPTTPISGVPVSDLSPVTRRRLRLIAVEARRKPPTHRIPTERTAVAALAAGALRDRPKVIPLAARRRSRAPRAAARAGSSGSRAPPGGDDPPEDPEPAAALAAFLAPYDNDRFGAVNRNLRDFLHELGEWAA
jgi:hypothetical protein